MSDLHCTWRDMAREAAERLAAAGIESPQRDARLLLADALGVDLAGLIARELDAIDGAALAEFEARIARRLAGEPVSRIRGWREFYGRRFSITPDVLDPRPETELLVEQGIARLPQSGRVLDLGTGSGCILVSVLAEREDASGVGVDISERALRAATANAFALGVNDRAAFLEGGWTAAGEGPFDLILSNPPYVAEVDLASLSREVREHDPHLALTGQNAGSGLDPYPPIAIYAAQALRPAGWLGVEFGAGQAADVAAIFEKAGLTDIETFADLSGLARAAFGRRKP